MTDQVTAAKEALELARKRIAYLAMFCDLRHTEANEKDFFPAIDRALEALSGGVWDDWKRSRGALLPETEYNAIHNKASPPAPIGDVPDEETGWLLEQNLDRPMWLCASGEDITDLTDDSLKAMRFRTKEDAIAVSTLHALAFNFHGTEPLVPTEHRWISAAQASQPKEV